MQREETSHRRSGRWRDCGKLLTTLTAAGTVTIALFFGGCSTSRKVETASRSEERQQSAERVVRDSAVEETVTERRAVTVPAETVRLMIATDSLRRLPEGASYGSRSGRASVKIGRKAATESEPERIYVETTCDSLQVQCETYERRIREQSRELRAMEAMMLQQRETRKAEARKTTNVIWTVTEWALIGLLAGILLVKKIKG